MTRIFCGNVSSKADIKELKDLFAECGKLKFFDVRDGSGYLVNIILTYKEYEEPQDTNEAIRKMNS